MANDEGGHGIVVVLKEDIGDPESILERIRTAVAGSEPNLKVISRLELHWRDLADAELVISVGGDGTLLQSTHYMKTGRIVGIHASSPTSKGHFMAYDRDDEFENISEYLRSARDPGTTNRYFARLPRLKAEIHQATGDVLSSNRAVNDYFIGNDIAGHPSKYRLSLPPGQPEYQRSSGVVCSTFQGMSGWVINILRNRMELYDDLLKEYRNRYKSLSSEFFYIVSQPMEEHGYEYGFTNQITITSEMAGGAIALDGFSRMNFNRKDEIDVRLSSHPIWVMKGDRHREWE